MNQQKDIVFDGTMTWAPFVEQTIDMVRDHEHNYRLGPGYHKDEGGDIVERCAPLCNSGGSPWPAVTAVRHALRTAYPRGWGLSSILTALLSQISRTAACQCSPAGAPPLPAPWLPHGCSQACAGPARQLRIPQRPRKMRSRRTALPLCSRLAGPAQAGLHCQQRSCWQMLGNR